MEVTFQVIGENEFIAKIERLMEWNTYKVREIVLENANEIQAAAKRRAKVDTGALAASIKVKTEDYGLTGVIYSTKSYAPYVEWGTRGGVSVPSEYQDLAALFRGHGGGMPPYKSLRGWASRHGAAGKEFLIARTIGRNGTKAQPFLIPSYEEQKPKFIMDMTKAYNNLEGEL